MELTGENESQARNVLMFVDRESAKAKTNLKKI